MNDFFTLERSDGIAHLTLNRPERLNTMAPPFFPALRDAVRALHDAGEARVLVISSTGRHFCAGMSRDVFGGEEAFLTTSTARARLRAREHMNRARVKSQNGPNQGARRSRGRAPAKPCNAEWARSGASPGATKGPFQIPGPGYPRALGCVATLARAASPGRASRLAQGPWPPRRGHDSYVHKL